MSTQQPPEESETQRRPSGFGRLSRRMTGWTSNLLATGLIVIAGLAFGSRVLKWWGRDTADPAEAVSTLDVAGPSEVGQPDRTHTLEIGGLPFRMHRSEFEGTREQALARLRAECRAMIDEARLPSKEPGDAEQRMLLRTLLLKPVLEQGARWQIFQIEAPLPMVVGIRRFQSAGSEAREEDSEKVADAERRVVSWGLGFHRSGAGWTLITLQTGDGNPSAIAGLPPLAVPPGSRQTLSIRAAGQETVIGLEGEGQPEAWIEFFDSWFAQHGWSRAAWRHSGPGWHARFAGSAGGWVDVQIAVKAEHQLGGLLTIVAPPARATKR